MAITMKKLLSVFLAAATVFMSFSAAYSEGGIKVLLDGTEIDFDVPPQIIDDFTYVPIRAIFEALGAEVIWDGDTKTVTSAKNGTEIIMTIGSNTMYVTGDAAVLEAAPVIIDGRTLVPVRAVAESFDCEVGWDGSTGTVTITSSAEEAPLPTYEPTAEPTGEPEAEFPIKYDDTLERECHYMRDFKITNIEKNDSGDYEITYTLRTFLEGRGTVAVSFRCLDADGSVVDSWTGMFVGTDYTWSYQEDTVTVSGRTAEIQLVLN